MSHFHICSCDTDDKKKLGVDCVLVCGCFRYRTFVSEDAGPNTLVATVLAKDPDGDGITYKITTGNEEGNFVIDSQKGQTLFYFVHHISSI